MQFDSQERKPIFYIILFGMLIFAIVFFAHNVKKAIVSGQNSQEAQTSQSEEADSATSQS